MERILAWPNNSKPDPARQAAELVDEAVSAIRNRGHTRQHALHLAARELGLRFRRARALLYGDPVALLDEGARRHPRGLPGPSGRRSRAPGGPAGGGTRALSAHERDRPVILWVAFCRWMVRRLLALTERWQRYEKIARGKVETDAETRSRFRP